MALAARWLPPRASCCPARAHARDGNALVGREGKSGERGGAARRGASRSIRLLRVSPHRQPLPTAHPLSFDLRPAGGRQTRGGEARDMRGGRRRAAVRLFGAAVPLRGRFCFASSFFPLALALATPAPTLSSSLVLEPRRSASGPQWPPPFPAAPPSRSSAAPPREAAQKGRAHFPQRAAGRRPKNRTATVCVVCLAGVFIDVAFLLCRLASGCWRL